MLENLSYADFAAQVNTKFRLTETEQNIELELVEAEELKASARQEAFSLIFLGPKEFLLPQQSYRMTHENLGEGMLFLVPIEQREEGFRYESVFNRFVESK